MRFNKKAAAAVLSVVLAAQTLGCIGASAATYSNNPNYIYIASYNAYFLKSECYLTANGVYLPYNDATPYYEGDTNNTTKPVDTTYKEFDNKVVRIEGKYYDMYNCYFDTKTNRYVPYTNAVGYDNYYTSYKDNGNGTVTVNGVIYNKTDCVEDHGRYYPKSGATSAVTYKEYDEYTVYIDGKYYVKKECNYVNGKYVPTQYSTWYNHYYSSYKDNGNQVYVNGNYYNKSDCIFDNGRYYPASLDGTAQDGSDYLEYVNGIIRYNGKYYDKTDCVLDKNGRYIPREGAKYYDHYYSSYKEYSDGVVYVNGHYYLISDCVLDNGRYYPKDINKYDDTYAYSNYKELDQMYFINGKYYDKTDCYLDTTTKKYVPYKNAVGYANYYSSYRDVDLNTVYVNGHYYTKSDCVNDSGRYYPKSGASNVDAAYASYKVYDTMVYINGLYYDLTECYKSDGKYVPYNNATGYNNLYTNYKLIDKNVVYVNSHYYKIEDCDFDHGRYYPKKGAVNYDAQYGEYKEYDYMVYVNGKYYNKSDCTYDAVTKRYSPKADAKGYSHNYTSYVAYNNGIVYVNGHYYFTKDCDDDNGRYYPKTGAENCDEYYASLNEKVSTDDPYLYNSSRVKGWSALINQVKNASLGTTTKINMNKTNTLSKKFLDSFKGTNKTVELVMSNGAVWKINGNDITNSAVDNTNIYIKYNTTDIPVGLKKAADALAQSYAEITIGNPTITKFGFTGQMTVKFKTRNAGKTAKLFRYDPANNYLIRTDYATIDSNGYATFDVDTSGIYALIIMKDQG